MSHTEQREISETLFEPAQTREEITDALRLEDERRAVLIKNMYRLRALRLSRGREVSIAIDTGEFAHRQVAGEADSLGATNIQ